MATTKLYLDMRSGAAPYPLKLTVTHERKATYMNLGVRLNPEQWDGVKIVKHPRAKMLNNQIMARKAEIDCLLYDWQCAGKLKGKSVKDVKGMLEDLTADEPAEQKVLLGDRLLAFAARKSEGTAVIYHNTLKMLQRYCDMDRLSMEEITPDWLYKLDEWLKEFSPSANARAIHYRNLRAVFNDALDDEVITNYPFRRFKIKQVETAKRSLSLDELRLLLNYDVQPYQRQYIDMFLLMILLRGINLVDLCYLRKGNLVAGRIEYHRHKTHKLYSIKVEPEAMRIIDKYRGDEYLIDIMDRYSCHNSYKSRFNKELKKIGNTTIGKHGKKTIKPLFPKLSTYWARHTFATIAYNDCGISMDVISDLLGHSNGMAVTNIYVRRNEKVTDEAARKIIDKILYDK